MQKLNLALAAILVVSLVSHTMEVKAQLNQYLISTIESFDLFVDSFKILASSPDKKFTLPNRGRPSRLVSTGRRGKCSQLKEPFIALIPHSMEPETALQKKEGDVLALGKTAELNPVFWFYVPELPKNVDKLELIIYDENYVPDTHIFNLTGTPGIFGFHPKLKQKLLSKKQYDWSASIVCSSSEPSKNPTVKSAIELIDLNPNLRNQLNRAAVEEKIQLYATNGIWHEMFTLLAQMDNHNNQQNANRLKSLLNDVGFEDIAKKDNIRYYLIQ